jgi:predicted Fe-S protein YdhL (DUF1289 family)
MRLITIGSGAAQLANSSNSIIKPAKKKRCCIIVSVKTQTATARTSRLLMRVDFATCDRTNAERFFADPAWDWLKADIKAFVLDNLDAEKLRVQDPMMYDSPCLVICDLDILDKINELQEAAE